MSTHGAVPGPGRGARDGGTRATALSGWAEHGIGTAARGPGAEEGEES